MDVARAFLKFLLFALRRRGSRLLQRKGSSYYSRRRSALCSEVPYRTLLCDVEGALLKSSSLFPYFMLVAFEAGGLLRAFLLLLLCPLLWLVGEEWALKLMVMVTFVGIREGGLRVGSAVLPKFLLENVNLESFEALMRAEKRVAVTEMPRVMVEVFLREYLNVEAGVARELKVVGGFYVGVMEKREETYLNFESGRDDVVGLASSTKHVHRHLCLFSKCKTIYMLSQADKLSCKTLPRERYPKALVFHDGRLAFRPTPVSTVIMFLWLPFGFLLAVFRAFVALRLPYYLSIPILSFTGMRLRFRKSPSTPTTETTQGTLYVCNHRTLLDPLYLSFASKKPITAVTYSLSRVSELLSPIKTVSLSRDREEDRRRMEGLLRQGDLVVCPEGTTCREPFLLRFSPLFAELREEIVPVAMNAHVSMFYGTTAGGLKCLDPLFFLMNPCPAYDVDVLEKVRNEVQYWGGSRTSVEVANTVQEKIGEVLGFECTKLTRKDKYLMLAGNEGIVPSGKRHGTS